MRTPSRTEAESLGADSLEAAAETDAVANADAESDARIVASAAAVSAVPGPSRTEDDR
jgi:branched-chain amino acid transport system permease protein